MRIHLPEYTLRILADAIAAQITIRTWNDGNSDDITRDSAMEECHVIHSVAFGTLLGLNFGQEARAAAPDVLRVILNTAEFTLQRLTREEVNTYDTIYCPLKAVIEAWRMASEPSRSTLSDWASRSVWRLFPAWLEFFDSLMAYEPEESYGFYGNLAEAETTLEGWRECGMNADVPQEDAGLLFLLWNLYVSDHFAARDLAEKKGV